MKNFIYSLTAGLAAAALMGSPALANGVNHHDCQGDTTSAHCRGHHHRPMPMNESYYRGPERVVPVYIDDDGAPRPMAPMAARGNELPPTDAGRWDSYWDVGHWDEARWPQ
ncbi:MAG: hypothetical protein HY053_09025 [Proteobacteria bacterium]|nr:hypothetical protein [Pseudomonadota bacterium]